MATRQRAAEHSEFDLVDPHEKWRTAGASALATRGRLIRAAVVVLCLATPGALPAQSDTLRFPQDDGIHRQVSFEMWSGFTHVKSSRGDTYSIMAFFFKGKVLGLGMSGVYGAVLDAQTGKFRDNRDLVTPIFGGKKHTAGRLDEQYDRSELSRDSVGAPYVIGIETGRLQFRLSLSPARDPVDLGRIPVGAGRTQRSYVVPRANVQGRLREESGADVTVEGIGLFQHAWGDSPDRSAAEDVLAIHLDDGTDIFALSGPTPDSAVLVVAMDSGARVMRHGFRLVADTVSEVGPLLFRRRWRLHVESPVLDLRVDPPTQGRRVSLLGIPYLIGRCVVQGEGPDGRPVSGVGYMYVRGRETAGAGAN